VKLGRRRVEHHDHAVISGRLAGENMTGAGTLTCISLLDLVNKFFGCIMCFQLHQLMSNSGRVVNVEC